MRLAAALAIAALAAAALGGCGSSSEPEKTEGARPAGNAPAGASAQACDSHSAGAAGLRVTGASCAAGRRVVRGWQRAEGCGLIGGSSRGSCAVRAYRCLATRTDRGVAVSCARPGRSIAFLAARD